MKVVAFLLLTIVASCSAQASPTVYSVITEFIDKYTETAVFTVSIDLTTGILKNVTEDFVYNGGSATIDGVSSFNPKTGTYWYATDAATPFIYATNVYQKYIDPPVDTGATYIALMRPNVATGLLYSIVEANGGLNYLISIRNDGTVKTLIQFPSSGFNFGYICAGTIDPVKNVFYLIVSTNASIPRPAYKVVTIDLTTFAILNSSPVLLNGPGFPQYFALDTASGNLYGLMLTAPNNKLQYYVTILNPTTGFVSWNLVPSITGIITCSTYSNQLQRLLMAETTGLLHFVNVATGKEDKPLKIGAGAYIYTLESVEVSA